MAVNMGYQAYCYEFATSMLDYHIHEERTSDARAVKSRVSWVIACQLTITQSGVFRS